MSTITVWILVAFLSSGRGNVVMIEDLATVQDCDRALNAMTQRSRTLRRGGWPSKRSAASSATSSTRR